MSENVYNALKWLVQLLLPASGTLYFALASIWSLPNAEQVVGTIAAVTVFLGVVLKIDSNLHAKHEEEVNVGEIAQVPYETDDGQEAFAMEFAKPLYEYEPGDLVKMRVTEGRGA